MFSHQLQYLCTMEQEVLAVKDNQRCFICNKTFDTDASLELHMLEHTEDGMEESVHEISQNISSITKEGSSHNLEQLNKAEYRCPICNKTYAANYTLTVHMYKHSGEYPFTCNICGLGLPSNSHLKAHLNKHNGERPHMCTVCGKTFSQKGVLKVHLLTHTDQKRYQCSVCQKMFRHLGSLKRHLSLHDEKRVKHFVKPCHQCTVCGKKFTAKHELRVHTMTHTGERPHQCEECGKTYTYIQSLKCHKRTHRSEKPYECSMCDKKYRHLGQLRAHTRTHTGERPYKCDVCGKGFVRNATLKVHMLIHTGERPYRCPICNKGFTMKVKLDSHMRSHTKEKPYGCKLCNKRFTEKATLRKHLAVHSDKQLYRCDICNKSFKLIASFRAHIKIHLNSKPYKSWIKRQEVFVEKESTEEVMSEAVDRNGIGDSKPLQNDASSNEHTLFSDELEILVLNHSNKRPHQCKICHELFNKEESLKKHILKHSKAWAHLVTVDKLFDQSVTIQMRQTSDSCYRCSACSKVFSSRDSAMKHLLVHKYVGFLNLKRILERHRRSKYTKGDKLFTDREKLNRQMLNHSGKCLFNCIFCSRSFDVCETLQDHILTHI